VEKSVLGKPWKVLIEEEEGGKRAGYTSNYIRIRTNRAGERNTITELIPTGIIRNGPHLELTDAN
jgi:hypothetical protein